MYATIQQPGGRSTRVTGIIAAVLMTVGAGYVFSSGLAQNFVRELEKKTELIMLAPEKVENPLPLPKEEPKVEVKVDTPPSLIVPDVPPLVQTPSAIVAVPAPPEAAPSPGPSGSDRAPPRLRAGDKPDYPLASIRAQEQGTTHLEVCVTDRGRVQAVSVVGSSGSSRLDQAAANWLRNERFTPGSVGGVPQSMCGHDVYYQWNLKDAR